MISVIVPLYNKRQSIVTTLDSVLSQTYTNFEIIVVDDGSTDGSGDIVKSIQDARIKYYYKENGGVSSARNFGVGKTQSDLIALLDGDDLWQPEYLEEMMSLIDMTPEAALWGSGYAFQHDINGKMDVPDLCISNGFKGYVENYWSVAKHNTLFTSSSVIINKNAFNSVGGYNESLVRGEDIDLWFRLALKYKVSFVNTPLVVYRLQAENRSNSNLVDPNKCLIWNLEGYKEYEQTNPNFKQALDGWRMAHVANCLRGESCEIVDVRPILKDVDLSQHSFIWKILKKMPVCMAHVVYNWYLNLKIIVR